mmetsp:Transcript_22324/g.58245  ORF Transcript_22324/g.58245 Transcript_22324/m.58245 type:complete len:114 (+) Transcript_22324:304-645(+)
MGPESKHSMVRGLAARWVGDLTSNDLIMSAGDQVRHLGPCMRAGMASGAGRALSRVPQCTVTFQKIAACPLHSMENAHTHLRPASANGGMYESYSDGRGVSTRRYLATVSSES